MKYLLLVIATTYHLLLLPCIVFLIVICGAKDWEMGEGFIFIAGLTGFIIFLPLAIWSTLIYLKWPVKYGRLQVVILGGILLSLVCGVIYFFMG